MLPPRKIRRISRHDRLPLLSLPDDTLMLVLRYLCGHGPDLPDGILPVLRGSSLAHARDAFSLAQCCSRLMRLFCASCLTRVDGTHIPKNMDPAYDSKGCWSQYQQIPHLRTVVWLAGENLRELHIPRYQRTVFCLQSVLEDIGKYCPRVHTISFQELDGMTMQAVEMLVAGVGTSIRSLSIGAPGLETIAALTNNSQCWLRKVELTSVNPKNINSLIDLIQLKGKRLESLRIVFDILEPYMDNGVANDNAIMDSVLYFKLFLGKRLMACCPKMQSFTIGLYALVEFQRHEYQQIRGNEHLYEDEVAAVGEFLQRSHRMTRQGQPSLDHFRISTTGDFLWYHVTDLSPLIDANTRVEVDLPGACIVLPRMNCASERPYYRSLLLTHLSYIPKALAKNDMVFNQVECLSVRIGLEPFWNSRNTYPLLQTLCAKAGTSLKSVCAELSETLSLSALSDLMLFAPNVTSLQVSPDFVARLSSVAGTPQGRQIIGVILSNLKIIRLRANDNLDSVLDMFVFVDAIPDFLYLVEKHCAHIEAIYFEKLSTEEVSNCSDEVRPYVRSAINAVECFETNRSSVDVSTVKSQLTCWMDECY